MVSAVSTTYVGPEYLWATQYNYQVGTVIVTMIDLRSEPGHPNRFGQRCLDGSYQRTGGGLRHGNPHPYRH